MELSKKIVALKTDNDAGYNEYEINPLARSTLHQKKA